jgi:hypothetical protein
VSDHTTRTIRIDTDYDKVLRFEAERRGLSVNSIIEELIDRYVYNDRFFLNESLISLAPSTLTSLLEGLSHEEINDSGRIAGRLRARDNLLIRGMTLNYNSLKWFILNVLDNYSGWFSCSYHEMDDDYMVHLRHNIGTRWSYFVQSYLESMVENLLEISLDAEILDSTVTLRIPKKML